MIGIEVGVLYRLRLLDLVYYQGAEQWRSLGWSQDREEVGLGSRFENRSRLKSIAFDSPRPLQGRRLRRQQEFSKKNALPALEMVHFALCRGFIDQEGWTTSKI
jgi:hypothetical protein